jgi:hypothetical protein
LTELGGVACRIGHASLSGERLGICPPSSDNRDVWIGSTILSL